MLDKAYRRPREIDPSDVVFDPRPPSAREAADDAIRDMKEFESFNQRHNGNCTWDADTGEAINNRDQIRDAKEAPEAIGPQYGWARRRDLQKEIAKYEDQSKLRTIDRIAELMHSLTYGEMTELAAELWAVSSGDITEQSLPQNLWDWAVKES